MDEKLNSMFNMGYFKALLDVADYFQSHSESIKQNHLYNKSGINKIMLALIFNNEELRETGTCELTAFSARKPTSLGVG